MQFIYNRKQKKTITDLMDTKQRPRETLKQFLERFTAKFSQIKKPDNLIASSIFRDGLNRDQELYEIFIRRPSNNIKEIITKTEDAFELKKLDLEGARLGT